MKKAVQVIQKAIVPKKEPPAAKANKRPVHKDNLRLAGLNAELNHKHPEPMALFHKREQSGEVPAVALKKPEVTLGQIDKAATAMAAWDNSDPFSYGRTALYVKQGYLNVADVVKEMGQRTIARRAAKSREVDDAKTK